MKESPQPFSYFVNVDDFVAEAGSVVCRVPANLAAKDDLMAVLASGLKFPGDFGRNWDALTDCLTDLSWIDVRHVAIVHEDLPLKDDGEQAALYREVLEDAFWSWYHDEGGHVLTVVFPLSVRVEVLSLSDKTCW